MNKWLTIIKLSNKDNIIDEDVPLLLAAMCCVAGWLSQFDLSWLADELSCCVNMWRRRGGESTEDDSCPNVIFYWPRRLRERQQ